MLLTALKGNNMDIRQENDQLSMVDKYACPKCGISGESEARKDVKEDLIRYYCKACKQNFTNMDYFTPRR